MQKDQKRQIKRLKRQHAAKQGRKERQKVALETGDERKHGQKVWIIPEFDAGEDEAGYLVNAVRDALPEYHCELAHVPDVTEDDIHQLMIASGEDGGPDE